MGLREAQEPDKIEATITVKEDRPWTFAVGLNNGGSESTGQDRFTVTGGHTNLFNLEDFVAREMAAPAADPSAPKAAGGAL